MEIFSLDACMDQLLHSPLFAGLSSTQLEKFFSANKYELVGINANEEIPTKLGFSYFVISGALGTYVINEQGIKTFANLFRSELNPLIPTDIGGPYPTVVAIAKQRSVVLLLETKSYLQTDPSLLITQNIILQNIVKILYATVKVVIDRTICNAEVNSKKKILMFLKNTYESQKDNSLLIPFTRSELASHLHMDTSTLMRDLKSLRNEGIIEYNRKEIIITDIDKLA